MSHNVYLIQTHVMQCVAVCCSVLQCVAVCCSVTQCISYTDTDIGGATEWRRIIGSPKLQVIFHKRATKYTSLLRKMTYKDKGSYESLPPCIALYSLQSPNMTQCMSYTVVNK